MSSRAVGYEILETKDQDGGLQLRLLVEGKEVARAAAAAETLDLLERALGMTGNEVQAELRQALEDVLSTQGQFVEISRLTELPKDSLKFSAQFISRLKEEVSTGLAGTT